MSKKRRMELIALIGEKARRSETSQARVDAATEELLKRVDESLGLDDDEKFMVVAIMMASVSVQLKECDGYSGLSELQMVSRYFDEVAAAI